MKIRTKFYILITTITLSVISSIYGVLQVSKGARFHSYNALQFKYNGDFSDELNRFRLAEKAKEYIDDLVTAISYIKDQPEACLSEINFIDRIIMRLIGTDITSLCEKDIKECDEALKSIDYYKKKKISKEELTASLLKAKESFRISSDQLMEPVNKTVRIIIVSMVSIIITLSLITLGLTIYISFSVLNRIKRVIDSLNDILQGKSDLSHIKESSNDELGGLINGFNIFLISLREMMLKLKNVSELSKSLGNRLEETMIQSAQALENMEENARVVEEKTLHLDNEIQSSNQVSVEVTDFISNVSRVISSQASSVEESSASIEEMSSSIQSLAEVAEEKYELTRNLEGTANAGEQEMKKTEEIIKKVNESTTVILELIGVINNIAEQTNLLAMNAAIEAAHAGAAGKGFAVVADEIRKLAESSGKNAKEITQSLKQVIEDINNSEEFMGRTAEFFNHIVKDSKNMANSMVEIKTVTHELAQGSQQVSQVLTTLNQTTVDVKNSSSDLNKEIEKMKESISTLTIISDETKSAMTALREGLTKVAYDLSDSRDLGEENSKNITVLDTMVGQFKIEL